MFRTVVVDDEVHSLREMEYLLNKRDVNVIGAFQNPLDSYEFIVEQKLDVVFLDIDMPMINGIDLAKKIKEVLPLIIVVFISGHTEYEERINKISRSYFISKPVEDQRLNVVISDILLKIEH